MPIRSRKLDVNLPNLYVSLIFKPWKGFSYKEGNWSFYNEFYAPPSTSTA